MIANSIRSRFSIAVENNPRRAAVRHSLLLPLALVAGCTIVGCTRNEYDIVMKPDGPAVTRKASIQLQTAQNPGKRPSPYQLAVRQLAEAYGKPVPKSDGTTFTASGRFSGKLPNDVGNSGRYLRCQSNLGSMVVYAERFRGNDDLYGATRKAAEAVDQLVYLTIGWVEKESRGEPDWPAVRAFLDGPFRRDLQNIALLSWSLGFLPVGPARVCYGDTDKCKQEESAVESRMLADVVLRAAQYLAERGYFQAEEVPLILRALRSKQPEPAMQFVRKSLASRLRPIAPKFDVDKLTFLRTLESLVASGEAYFVGTDYFRQHRDAVLAAIRKEDTTATKVHTEQEVASKMLVELFFNAFAPYLRTSLREHDALHLALDAPRAPLWTNGHWDSARKKIEWKSVLSISTAVGEVPAFCYAIWCEPDTEAQQRLFGKTALDGEPLTDYCLWYGGLTADEQKEWDAFVKPLKYYAAPIQRLSDFRFSQESPKLSASERLAFPAIEILKENSGNAGR
jgi:hypothetical protein